jgi:UDP-glucose 4-epimerase
MHFAASALRGESMENPSKYFRNNVANGLNLLDAMVPTGTERLVFSSTCAIFCPPERVPIDEDLPKRPINPYGESKLAFERILRWYGQIHGLKFVSLRYFNAAGASARFGEDHRVETHLIPNVLKVALRREIGGGDLWHRLRHAGWHVFAITFTSSTWRELTSCAPILQKRILQPGDGRRIQRA